MVTAARAPVAETVATTVPRSTVAVRKRVTEVRFAETTYPAVARAARAPTPTSSRVPRRPIPFIVAPDPLATPSWTRPGRGCSPGRGSYGRPTTRSSDGEPDPVVGHRPDTVRLGVRQGELGLGQLEDGADPGVVTAPGQPEVLLRRLDRLLRRAEALGGLDHRDVRLLHLEPDLSSWVS
mgnify:CR=1 FL=1